MARAGKPRRRLVAWALVPCALAAAWTVGLARFTDSLPRAPQSPERQTDAIVVLTGGSERLAAGLELLDAGLADKLFVSGVYRGVDVAELLRVTAGDARLTRRIALGHEADDTVGNARETAAWMAAEGYASLRLVTAAYHMPRSLIEFKRMMPGIEVIAHPVFPTAVRLDRWWRFPGTAILLAGEYTKYLLAGLRARFA